MHVHSHSVAVAAGSDPARRPSRVDIVHRSVHHHATLNRTFFALSDPTRRSILERLAGGPATIGELAESLGLTLNGVKKHVGILEDVDLVVTAKVGRARECQLGPAQLEDATGWIEAYRRGWERRLDRFGAYVEERNAGRG
jgi:DNA-binding transcriptional ArsR family regulator